MKKFKEYIKEEWSFSDIADGYTLEVFKNPTARELAEIYKMGEHTKNEARAYIDKKSGDLYVWNVDILHNFALNSLEKQIGWLKGFNMHIKDNVVYFAEANTKQVINKIIKTSLISLKKSAKKNPSLKFKYQNIYEGINETI